MKKEKLLGYRENGTVIIANNSQNSRNNINCTSSYNCGFTYSSRYYNYVCYVR